MHKYLLSLIILISFISCNTKREGKYETNGGDDICNNTGEEIQGFKHNKKYINPLVVYSFMCPMSDPFQYWNEIDLTASDNSNGFFINGKIQIEDKSIYNCPRVIYVPNDAEDSGPGFEMFSYAYLGCLNNGVELIHYFESSKGTAKINGLIGFTFSERRVAGDSAKHIFMRQEKQFGLQQYCKFELDKENNRVLVKPFENMVQADFCDMPMDPFYVDFPKEATEALRESLQE